MGINEVSGNVEAVRKHYKRTPLNLVEAAKVAACSADRNAEIVDEIPGKIPLACKPGCDHCCYIEVGISVPEAFMIADHLIRTLTAEELASLKVKLREFKAAVGGRRSKTGQRPMLPCVFLKDHQCSIYSVRPLTCRKFASYSEPACQFCFTETKGLSEIPHPITREFVVSLAHMGEYVGLSERGLPDPTIEMNEALIIILDDFQGVMKAWLKGVRLFSLCELPVKDGESLLRGFLKKWNKLPYYISKIHEGELKSLEFWDEEDFMRRVKEKWSKPVVPGTPLLELKGDGSHE